MTLNLAPMVDVMMCLIIFFLLASRLADVFQLDLPSAVAAEVVERGEIGNRVTIAVRHVTDDDRVAEYVVRDWDGQRVTDRVLGPDEVVTLLQARASRARQEQQPLRCVIAADQMVMYRHIEVVLRGCGLARIEDVVFTVNQASGTEGPV